MKINGYEIIIGLEVHAQLLTKSKMFCGCSVEFGAEPNSLVCPICLGMPGALPFPNKRAIELALKAALALKCEIVSESIFARKNYFYPDLPKNYQISQFEKPLAIGGYIVIQAEEGEKKIRIRRLHLEEDAGKLIHGIDDEHSYVDFNRCGVPLIEIVSEPDIRSPQEAYNYLVKLRRILMYLDVCDGNMEEGSLRCDANISLRKIGDSISSIKVELKNLNSFRNLQKALEYEVERQKALIAEGKNVEQETRMWDAKLNQTVIMRTKEEAHDYRYFPEPDLLYLKINKEWLEEIKKEVCELPDEKYRRFMQQYQLSAYDAEICVSTKELADFYEAVVSYCKQPKAAANWIINELLREIKKEDTESFSIPITAEQLGELIILIEKGKISGKIGKMIFAEMLNSKKMPSEIIEEKNLIQIKDETELKDLINKILENHPEEVNSYLNGKERIIGYLMGLIMKESGGKANPQLSKKLLLELLEERRKKSGLSDKSDKSD